MPEPVEPAPQFPECLHTLLITDGSGDEGRIRELVHAALAGGIQAIQLREPGLGAARLSALCGELRSACRAHGALLVVNDRADVAAAGGCDAVQLGHRSLRPEVVRGLVPEGVRIGGSVHDAAEITAAAAADFVLLSPLFPTRSKPGAAPLLTEVAQGLVAAAAMPVVLLGGIDVANAAQARQIGAAGIAVMSAICAAGDPEAAARALVASRRMR